MLRAGTTCSGIGSPEQALKNLNIPHEVKFAIEIDKFARETYQANHEPDEMHEDITKVDAEQLPDIDLFVAGFPCQAFSIAGKRKGLEDTRGTIFFDCLRILKAKQPKYFILENVKGLLSDQDGATFDTIINSLSKTVNGQLLMFPNTDSLNYHVYYKVINARDHGIPQNRDRVFIIGFREDQHSFDFPETQELKLALKDILEYQVDEKYKASQKQIEYLFSSEISKGRTRIDLNMHHSISKGIANTITACIGRGNANSYLIDDSLVSINQIKSDIIQMNNPKHSNNRVYHSDGVSPSLNTMQGGNRQPFIYHQDKIRRLTPLECMRLMGFNDGFVIPVSDTQKYKQAGNSIVVDVLESLLLEVLKNEKKGYV